MSEYEIAGQLTVEYTGLGGVRERLVKGNAAFKTPLYNHARAVFLSGSRSSMYMQLFPWKSPPGGYTDDKAFLNHGYPYTDINNTAVSYHCNIGWGLSVYDYARYRAIPSNPWSQASSDQPRIVSAVLGATSNPNSSWKDNVASITDVPGTQIGNPFLHPIYANITADITAGSSWVKATAGTHWYYCRPGVVDSLYLTSGASAGLYKIRQYYYDGSYKWIQLANLDGSLFNPTATETGVTGAIGPNRSFFNQTQVIPQSTGTVAFDGTFDPGLNRMSYICRIKFEKSGSPSPDDASQKGTYWFSLRPYHMYSGDLGDARYEDAGFLFDYQMWFDSGFWSACRSWVGSVAGYALDETRQRLWMISTNGTDGDIAYWTYKSVEGITEVACSDVAGPKHQLLTPAIPMAANVIPMALEMGSDQTVYVALFKRPDADATKAGLAVIHPDLTTEFLGLAAGLPSDQLINIAVDRTAAREGTGTVNTNVIDMGAVETFAAKDLGRVVKLNDSQLVKISAVNSAFAVTVTDLAGGAVDLGTGAATWEIGDRIYLFFSDVTSNDGHIHYVESLAPTTVFEAAMTGQVNGKQLAPQNRYGESQKTAVDPKNGRVYWLSNDVQYQVNCFDPATGTFTYLTCADLNTINGSPAGTTPTTPTALNAVAINPHPEFREIWVGHTHGHTQLDPDDFTNLTKVKRYQGNDQNSTGYQNPTGYYRNAGAQYRGANTQNVRCYAFLPDGHAYCVSMQTGTSNYYINFACFSHESENWYLANNDANGRCYVPYNPYFSRLYLDPYGCGMYLQAGGAWTGQGYGTGTFLYGFETQYQWNGSSWYPKEVVRGSLPDSASSPGCKTKEMHADLQDLVMGVQVKFTPQGGSTPPNNEFLGRLGVVKPAGVPAVRSDGILSTSSNIFTGSSFQAGDVGNYVRIESGTLSGTVLRIASYTDTGHVTLSKLDNGAWTSTVDESGLQYSIWSAGVVGSNAGPEVCSVLLADGIGKDNTQDIGNISYEMFWIKTKLYENAEQVKFCAPVLGPTGGRGVKTYWETFGRISPQYNPALGAHLGLPASPVANDVMDGLISRSLDGLNNKVDHSSPIEWYGIYPDTQVVGEALSIDLGKDVEVGFVIARFNCWRSNYTGRFNGVDYGAGNLTNLYNAQDDNAAGPQNSSTIRCSGASNLSLVYRNSTISLSSGDFLGAGVGTGQTDGSIVAGGNVLTSVAGRFAADAEGMILRVIGGCADIGAYRITSVNTDGSAATVRNLDQTAKAWSGDAGAVSYQVFDGVQEEDVIAWPNISSPTGKLVVERLLTTTTAQVRISPHVNASLQSWDCVKPTWRKVKRLSYSYAATPPEVANNKTWSSFFGKKVWDLSDTFFYFDITDLDVSKRTGRWWKLAIMPRSTVQGESNHRLDSIEFYDPAGNRIGLWDYNRIDAVTQPNFECSTVNRIDFLMGDSSLAESALNNGTCALNNDTVTLTQAGAAFTPYRLRTTTGGSFNSGSNTFTSTSSFFKAGDVGKWLQLRSGDYEGQFFRILSVPTASSATLGNINGTGFTFANSGSSVVFAVYEGINVGATNPDYIWIDGVGEFPILSISQDRKTITLPLRTKKTISGAAWELRRRAVPLMYANPAADASATARIFGAASYRSGTWYYADGYYPFQAGDVTSDHAGYQKFHDNDVGGFTRTNGATTATSNTFDGGEFSKEDVGRILFIESDIASVRGPYLISSFVSSSQVTVKNMDGSAVTWASSESSLFYKVYGERRYRIVRYSVGLKA